MDWVSCFNWCGTSRFFFQCNYWLLITKFREMNRYILLAAFVICIVTHYGQLTASIPILVLGLILLIGFVFSGRLINETNTVSKYLTLYLFIVYIGSGIVFLLDFDSTQRIIMISAGMFVVTLGILQLLTFFASSEDVRINSKKLLGNVYFMFCLNMVFMLLHEWHN